jgi:hypothetical protein
MNLRVYLAINNMSVKDFSEIIDVNKSYLSGIIRGRMIPSKKLSRQVFKQTQGEVLLREFRKEQKPDEQPQENQG